MAKRFQPPRDLPALAAAVLTLGAIVPLILRTVGPAFATYGVAALLLGLAASRADGLRPRFLQALERGIPGGLGAALAALIAPADLLGLPPAYPLGWGVLVGLVYASTLSEGWTTRFTVLLLGVLGPVGLAALFDPANAPTAATLEGIAWSTALLLVAHAWTSSERHTPSALALPALITLIAALRMLMGAPHSGQVFAWLCLGGSLWLLWRSSSAEIDRATIHSTTAPASAPPASAQQSQRHLSLGPWIAVAALSMVLIIAFRPLGTVTPTASLTDSSPSLSQQFVESPAPSTESSPNSLRQQTQDATPATPSAHAMASAPQPRAESTLTRSTPTASNSRQTSTPPPNAARSETPRHPTLLPPAGERSPLEFAENRPNRAEAPKPEEDDNWIFTSVERPPDPPAPLPKISLSPARPEIPKQKLASLQAPEIRPRSSETPPVPTSDDLAEIIHEAKDLAPSPLRHDPQKTLRVEAPPPAPLPEQNPDFPTTAASADLATAEPSSFSDHIPLAEAEAYVGNFGELLPDPSRAGLIGELIPPSGHRPTKLYLRQIVLEDLRPNGFFHRTPTAAEGEVASAEKRPPAPFFRRATFSGGWWTLRLATNYSPWVYLPSTMADWELPFEADAFWSSEHHALRLNRWGRQFEARFRSPRFTAILPVERISPEALIANTALFGLPEVDAALRDLALRLAGGDPELSADAFTQRALGFLHARATYALKPRFTPDAGPDLWAWIRTGEAGYCQHFAGAYALLTRAYGIPTRVVVGAQLDSDAFDGHRYLIGENNLHAWAETLDGNHWQRVEATPPSLESLFAASPPIDPETILPAFDPSTLRETDLMPTGPASEFALFAEEAESTPEPASAETPLVASETGDAPTEPILEAPPLPEFELDPIAVKAPPPTPLTDEELHDLIAEAPASPPVAARPAETALPPVPEVHTEEASSPKPAPSVTPPPTEPAKNRPLDFLSEPKALLNRSPWVLLFLAVLLALNWNLRRLRRRQAAAHENAAPPVRRGPAPTPHPRREAGALLTTLEVHLHEKPASAEATALRDLRQRLLALRYGRDFLPDHLSSVQKEIAALRLPNPR